MSDTTQFNNVAFDPKAGVDEVINAINNADNTVYLGRQTIQGESQDAFYLFNDADTVEAELASARLLVTAPGHADFVMNAKQLPTQFSDLNAQQTLAAEARELYSRAFRYDVERNGPQVDIRLETEYMRPHEALKLYGETLDKISERLADHDEPGLAKLKGEIDTGAATYKHEASVMAEAYAHAGHALNLARESGLRFLGYPEGTDTSVVLEPSQP